MLRGHLHGLIYAFPTSVNTLGATYEEITITTKTTISCEFEYIFLILDQKYVTSSILVLIIPTKYDGLPTTGRHPSAKWQNCHYPPPGERISACFESFEAILSKFEQLLFSNPEPFWASLGALGHLRTTLGSQRLTCAFQASILKDFVSKWGHHSEAKNRTGGLQVGIGACNDVFSKGLFQDLHFTPNQVFRTDPKDVFCGPLHMAQT